MKSYNGYTPEQRNHCQKLINRAIDMGIFGKPCECSTCGQDKGIIHYHCEDYGMVTDLLTQMIALAKLEPTDLDDTGKETLNDLREEIKIPLIQMCWRCHMMYHSKHRSPKAVDLYFKDIAAGMKYPPVYKHDFKILNRDHGIR